MCRKRCRGRSRTRIRHEDVSKILGPIEFKIACMHCVCSRINLNPTCQQSQAVASKIVNKITTRNSLKLLALHFTVSLSDSATKNNSASSVMSNNNSKTNLEKNATKPSNKRHIKRRPRSKSKKLKGQSFYTLKELT